MSDDIFNLLMMVLMCENGGSTESINQMIIMFMLLNRNQDSSSRSSRGICGTCGREDGFTF